MVIARVDWHCVKHQKRRKIPKINLFAEEVKLTPTLVSRSIGCHRLSHFKRVQCNPANWNRIIFPVISINVWQREYWIKLDMRGVKMQRSWFYVMNFVVLKNGTKWCILWNTWWGIVSIPAKNIQLIKHYCC